MLLLLAWLVPAAAATLVQPTDDLTAALANAAAGAELVLADGSYMPEYDSDTALYFNKSITIRALNPGQAILDGENMRRVVHIGGTVTGHERRFDGLVVGFLLKGGSTEARVGTSLPRLNLLAVSTFVLLPASWLCPALPGRALRPNAVVRAARRVAPLASRRAPRRELRPRRPRDLVSALLRRVHL